MGESEDPANRSSYYLRSKKRKLDNGEEGTSCHSHSEAWRRKNPIMHVPLEVLQNVFKFIPFQELSDKVRKVNRKFKLAAEDLLNRSFKGIEKKLQALTSTTLSAVECTQDDMELKCLCRLLNLLDIVNFQQSVIMATIWRYVYNEYYRTTSTCMYAGSILDLYETFFCKFTTRPYQIYGPAVVKDYALPEEVKVIIQLTKIFCIHFDKISEETIKHSLSVSGCKIIDLLDCASFAKKEVVFEQITGNTFSAKYSYHLQNAWFVSFDIPPDKEMSLKQKQRMMHMRIRRIILAHTEMFMQQSHYERESVLRVDSVIKKPSVVVYTGYGDVQDTFFCYGAMNDAAYLQKFSLEEEEEHDDEDLEDEMFIPEELPLVNQQEGGDEDQDLAPLAPFLGLSIAVKVDCPIAFAPYRYVNDNKQMVKSQERKTEGMFNLKVKFHFPGAFYPRLSPYYKYHKRVCTRHEA